MPRLTSSFAHTMWSKSDALVQSPGSSSASRIGANASASLSKPTLPSRPSPSSPTPANRNLRMRRGSGPSLVPTVTSATPPCGTIE